MRATRNLNQFIALLCLAFLCWEGQHFVNRVDRTLSLAANTEIKETNIENEEAASLMKTVDDAVKSATGTLSFRENNEAAASLLEQVMLDTAAANSATGSLFGGEKIRSFDGPLLFKNFPKDNHQSGNDGNTNTTMVCSKWNVVTTIFAPTEAVKRAAAATGWCTVIVADTKTPANYMEEAGLVGQEDMVHFLTVEDQQQWATETTKVGDFVRAIPYRHFARKNLGYLYAIQRGAKFIFDFDDDNLLHKDGKGDVLSPLADEQALQNARMVMIGKDVLNHHELMGASVPGSWARGFPLQSIHDKETRGRIAYNASQVDMDSIAVMQFVAQENPDIDAIHRLTKPLPMGFNEVPDHSRTTGSLVVPSHAFVPYNAQATVHTHKALWALFLPFTVPGRVSDIWRGYFSEALFRDLGLSVAILPPKITQDRNEHNYLADMKAELDLYFKTGKLIEFLGNWSSTADTIPERMEQLWIDLYERDYIEENDVKVVQLWLQALAETGYEFPPIVRTRYDNLVLMGQFNYANQPDTVVFWAQRWREVFNRIVVRGPFNETQVAELVSRGIQVKTAVSDKGYFSPMRNLMETLQEFKSLDGIDGVLYLHDDGLLNMTELTAGVQPFPSQDIIGTKHHSFPLSYADVRDPATYLQLASAGSSFRILPDGSYSNATSSHIRGEDLRKLLHRKWGWWSQCIPALRKVSSDPRMSKYLEKDGSMAVPSPTQADFLFVPTKLADAFAEAATIVLDSGLFLECAAGTIVQMLRVSVNATVSTTPLCTEWLSGERGSLKSITTCREDTREDSYGMIHPLKFNQGKTPEAALQNWARGFDMVTYGAS